MKTFEILLLVALVGWQLYLFFRFNWPAIRELENVYPDSDSLDIDPQGQVEVIALDPDYSPEFKKIVTDTNRYLRNNQGAAADLGLLKDISESSAESMDERVQTQVSTPLYLGLLGTFVGAIIGILSLIPSDPRPNPAEIRKIYQIFSQHSDDQEVRRFAKDSATFYNQTTGTPEQEQQVHRILRRLAPTTTPIDFDDFHYVIYPDTNTVRADDIGRFLLGIMLAMCGSLTGLGLTLLGNLFLKDARTQRNERKKDYYNFLRVRLLPKLNTDMQAGMSSLRSVLDSFHGSFFSKIQTEFFAKIAQFTPLVGKMTENIAMQRDFLMRIESIGINQMANATIRVFNRVEESAGHFDKFLGYQQALNDSIEKGVLATQSITAMLGRLTALEEAIRSVPGYLATHDESIRRWDTTLREWVEFFTQHRAMMDNLSADMVISTREADHRLRQMMEERHQQLETQSAEAFEKWRRHFARLEDENVYQKIVETYLAPLSGLPVQQTKVNKLVEDQSKLVAQALARMEQRLAEDRKIQLRLEEQLDKLTQLLKGQNSNRPEAGTGRAQQIQGPKKNRNGQQTAMPGDTSQPPVDEPAEAPESPRTPQPGWLKKFSLRLWQVFVRSKPAAVTPEANYRSSRSSAAALTSAAVSPETPVNDATPAEDHLTTPDPEPGAPVALPQPAPATAPDETE